MTAVLRRLLVAATSILVACSDGPSSPSTIPPRSAVVAGLSVTAVTPSEVARDTTLDIVVVGSGFDRGSRASIERDGVVDARVRVNATRYARSTQLVANVTVAADAQLDLYDVVVVTSGGKKGIGTELLAVTIMPELVASARSLMTVDQYGTAFGTGTDARRPTDCDVRPALWRIDGSREWLPLPSGVCTGSPLAVNASGVVAGYHTTATRSAYLRWLPTGGGYTYQLVGAPSGEPALVLGRGITDDGSLVAWSQHSPRLYWWSPSSGWSVVRSPEGASECQIYHALSPSGAFAARCLMPGGLWEAFFWSSHEANPMALPRPPGAGTAVHPRDINGAGVIVGNGDGVGALRWMPVAGSYVVERLPDAGWGGVAAAITEDGTIFGGIGRDGNGWPQPAMWAPDGSFLLLGTLGTKETGEAHEAAVTSEGWFVVGSGGGALRWTVRF